MDCFASLAMTPRGRIVTLDGGETIANAVFDRGFVEAGS
ncbi:hypothetical protein DFR50_12391 [Roseiarcus fermentans]|uniref:Uncharacterized protein n=1 Tax=Roseiarcus fermentans TaxID=1473586 RepID=A0A366F5S9_9HYPH|nr:hypothetical protein DFR50_12391 [Roseiarcus fermentans]